MPISLNELSLLLHHSQMLHTDHESARFAEM